MALRVLVCHTETVAEIGMASVLGAVDHLLIKNEGGDGRSMLAHARAQIADVIVADIELLWRDGGGLIGQILDDRGSSRSVVIVLIVADVHDSRIASALRMGVHAVVSADDPAETIKHAVLAAARGKNFLGPNITGRFISGYDSGPSSQLSNATAVVSTLTAREKEILRLIACGRSNHEISRDLSISAGTVRYHVGNLLRKMSVVERTQAMAIAYGSGLLDTAPALGVTGSEVVRQPDRHAKPRALICAESSLVSEGLLKVLGDSESIEAIDAVDREDKAFEVAMLGGVRIVILVMATPRYGSAAHQWRTARDKGTDLVALVADDRQETLNEAIRRGARGLMLLAEAPTMLNPALSDIVGGKAFVSPQLAGHLAEEVLGVGESPEAPVEMMNALTMREQTVLALLARGRSNTRISKDLDISESTVRSHLHNLMKKLGLKSRTEAVAFVYQSGKMWR